MTHHESRCLRCGTTESSLLAGGRFGCGQCAKIFDKWIPRVVTEKELTFWQYIESIFQKYSLPFKDFDRELQKVITGQTLPKTSIRIRYSRSMKGYDYETNVKTREIIISLLRKKMAGMNNITEDKPISSAFWRAYFFDEDHLRLEAFSGETLPVLDPILRKFLASSLFDYVTKTGFVNSCPTNCGRGNKISAIIDLKGLILAGEITHAIQFLPSFIQLKDQNRLGFLDSSNSSAIVYVKNYTEKRKKIFLGIIFALQKVNEILKKHHSA